MSKFLLELYAFYLADKHLSRLGNLDACHFGYCMRLLSYDFCVERAVDKNGLAHLIGLLRIEEVSASCLNLFLEFVVYALEYDNGLLACANHTVVEGLGVEYRGRGKHDIRAVVNDCGSVARAYAHSGLTAGVSGFNHTGTARSKDEVRLAHKLCGKRNGGLVNPTYDIFGSTRLNSRLVNYFCRLYRAALRAGMRREDDAVAGLKSNKCLKDSG